MFFSFLYKKKQRRRRRPRNNNICCIYVIHKNRVSGRRSQVDDAPAFVVVTILLISRARADRAAIVTGSSPLLAGFRFLIHIYMYKRRLRIQQQHHRLLLLINTTTSMYILHCVYYIRIWVFRCVLRRNVYGEKKCYNNNNNKRVLQECVTTC